MVARSDFQQVAVFTASRRRLHDEVRSNALGTVPLLESWPYEIPVLDALADKLGWERAIFSRNIATRTFSETVANFLRTTFLQLGHLRPGSWEVCDTAEHGKVEIGNFSQYEHIVRVRAKALADPDLRAALGGDYLIAPDVVVLRTAEPDEVLNRPQTIVDAASARLAPLRASNTNAIVRFLHASVSCKWTLRSDRAQNARSEALNLLRNRKGHAPHVVAVTAEPLPSRLASLALGTNDLDCAYHIALPELCDAVAECVDGERSDQGGTLEMLINGRRLRDISDLPLDLAV